MHDLSIAEIDKPEAADNVGLSSLNFTQRAPEETIFGK